MAEADRPKPETKEDKLKQFEADLLASVKQDDDQAYAKASRCYQSASDARRRYDWEWLSRDLFRRGYQFTRYNSQSKTVTMSATSSARIPVNLTVSALRVIKNQVTAFRPKWIVMPTNIDDEASDNAKYSEKTLDYVYILNRLKKHIKETVMQGLLFSVGSAWQIHWDKDIVNEDGSKGFVSIWLIDPFDFYVDPSCTDGLAFTDAEYVIKAVRRPLSEVKTNKNYKNTDLLTTGDNRVASSEYKQFLLQSLKFMGSYTQTPEGETIILKEGWFKERDKNGKVRMRIITWTDSASKPLRNELTTLTDFPFRMYQADLNPLEMYGEGWARHVIPINRVLNTLESSMFDFNYKFAKGRLIMDKNAGVNFVTNEHGSIIEKNRGSDVRSLQVPPLPASHESQILRMRQYFEDISGAHDVSLGRIPVGVKSGIGIAELKQADATNQDDLVDNLEDFLIEVGKKVLELISDNLEFPMLVKATNIAGKADYFTIVGKKYKKDSKKEYKIGKSKYPIGVIEPNNTIRVQIGSWLAFSKQQRQQELKDLYTSGVIDQQTLLEHLEFGDVDSILERTKQEAILKTRRELQKVKSDDVTEEELATQESKMLLDGDVRVTALPDDDHDVHIAVHKKDEGNKLIDFHIQQHLMLKDAKREVEQAAKSGEIGANTPAIEPTGAEGVPPEILQAGQTVMQNEQQQNPQVPPPPPIPPTQQPVGMVGGVPAGEIPA